VDINNSKVLCLIQILLCLGQAQTQKYFVIRETTNITTSSDIIHLISRDLKKKERLRAE
jgi:hypothetical protein